MVFVMDKMKDHSCVIQPVFGLGAGGGLTGLNFAFMLDQMLNPDNFMPLIDDDDDPSINVPTLNFPPISPVNFPPFNVADFNPFTNQQPQPNNQNPSATEQSNQNTGNQQQPPSIHQLVANAIQHHVATHQALLNNTSGTPATGSNNTPQPQLSVSQIIQNTINEVLQMPSPPPQPLIGIPGVVAAQAIQFQVISDTTGSLPVSVTEPQVFLSLPSNNGLLQQYVVPPGESQPVNVHFSLTNPNVPVNPEFFETFPSVLLNSEQNIISTDEDSSSSAPAALHVPFSSPALSFAPTDFNTLNEDDSPIASNIVIIDSAENFGNVGENQSNHTNVPN